MRLLLNPATVVWAALMLATCISTWGLPKDALSPEAAVAAIMLIAAVKLRLVLNHFMELAHAPWEWRLPFEAWTAICTAAILGIYLHTASMAAVAPLATDAAEVIRQAEGPEQAR